MPVAHTRSVALLGIDGAMVDVEADLSNGLPALTIIGLPDAALGEARHRVRAAAVNAGCPLSGRKLTVNLSPAELPKHGSAFDLAVAVACLAAAGDVSRDSIASVAHLGELGLDGRLRPIAGILPAVLAAERAGCRTVMVPAGNLEEAALVPGVAVVPVTSLRDAAIWHGGSFEPVVQEPVIAAAAAPAVPSDGDLADVVGNDEAVEALVTAAAGGHHLFLLGPPGSGKSMLAHRLPTLLPDLGDHAALELTSVASLNGASRVSTLLRRPPFEAPHHTASAASIVGGGSGIIRPGAAARASHGVLFLDEAPEFPAHILDVLRQPLETGQIVIHRARARAVFPARFQLVLAANPCPCGQYGVGDLECTCPPIARRRYLARISGPLADRIDIQLTTRRVRTARIDSEGAGRTTSVTARRRVVEARAAAAERFARCPWSRNADAPGSWLRLHARTLGNGATKSLDRALERGALTMRGYDRVLRLAWTIADVDGAARPTAEHIGRALFLRRGIAA
jgi:magnesium chelatase family protein